MKCPECGGETYEYPYVMNGEDIQIRECKDKNCIYMRILNG